MLPEHLSDPIAYLLKRKFGGAVITAMTDLPEDEQEAQLFAEVQTYRTELQGLSDEQLLALAYQEREKEARELVDAQEEGRFFNQPETRADYEYWSRLPLWTLDEAVALSLGKNPAIVTWSGIEEYAESSPFAARFANLRRFVLRANEAQQLSKLISPTDYIAWAKANGVHVPSDLEESVQASSGEKPDWKALYEEEKLRHASTRDELERHKAAGKPLSEKEKNSYHKLLLGMAVAFHGYDPHASRSPVPRQIADELKSNGISIDEDTVRDKLQDSAEKYGHLVPEIDEG